MELNRAVFYAASTRDGKQDTENQLIQLREFARTQDWIVVREYVDRITGKHSDRDEFQRLFRDAAQRKFDVVVFWSLDRFSREGVRETLNHRNVSAAMASATGPSLSSTSIPVGSSRMRSWPFSP